MLNKDSRFARPVSRPAGNRDGAQDVEPARIGICSGFLDLAQDIKRPELEDRYGYFRISQILGPKLARELLLELDLRQAGRLYGARQRQRDVAARIDLIIAAERGLSVDIDPDLLPRLHARRSHDRCLDRILLGLAERPEARANAASRSQEAQEQAHEQQRGPRTKGCHEGSACSRQRQSARPSLRRGKVLSAASAAAGI